MPDAAQAVTRFSYDENGNQMSVEDALTHRWMASYDTKNRVTATTDPLNRSVRVVYDTGPSEQRDLALWSQGAVQL
ncbi:MAG: RHS repeat domain-containing protein [Acidobacteriota bacterium]